MIPGRIYRHFKGGRYRVLFLARDAETTEPVVVYSTLGLDKEPTIWVRKAKEWDEVVVVNGTKHTRFTIEEEVDL